MRSAAHRLNVTASAYIALAIGNEHQQRGNISTGPRPLPASSHTQNHQIEGPPGPASQNAQRSTLDVGGSSSARSP